MFLENSESISARVETLFRTHSTSAPICIAVAFWGFGAEALFASRRATFRIVCNLSSSGTNPHVIRRLREMENVDILQLNKLHAKVVISDGGAIVSSANFSTNGLGLEGTGTSLEAGVFVAALSTTYADITEWFLQTWSQSKPIYESDLIRAEEAWARREAASRPATAAPGSDMLNIQTVHFEGRIRPRQRNLRSAAAILALNGQAGDSMPYSAFVFLFSGGISRDAFENHREKFVVIDDSVRLNPSFVGYFIGTDGRLESCTDSKRRKSADGALLDQTAAWMLRRGARPATLEGVVQSTSCQRVRSQ
jgi:hypothetical protein